MGCGASKPDVAPTQPPVAQQPAASAATPAATASINSAASHGEHGHGATDPKPLAPSQKATNGKVADSGPELQHSQQPQISPSQHRTLALPTSGAPQPLSLQQSPTSNNSYQQAMSAAGSPNHIGLQSMRKRPAGAITNANPNFVAGLQSQRKSIMMINLPPPTPKKEPAPETIHSHILTCRNCEVLTVPPVIWCTACHNRGDEAPPVFCEKCNTDLHQFAKTKTHARDNITKLIHTTEIKDPYKPPADTPADTVIPPLESLGCTNCDSSDIKEFCSVCRTILCGDCARDIHKPKLLAMHVRTPLTHRYIMAGAGKRTDLLPGTSPTHEKEVNSATGSLKNAFKLQLINSSSSKNKSTALNLGLKPAPTTAGSSSANTAARPGLSALARIGGIKPLPTHGSSAGSPTAAVEKASPSSPAAAASSSHNLSVSGVDMQLPPASYRPLQKARQIDTDDDSDIVPSPNHGMPGDVFIMNGNEISLSDMNLNEIQLEFHNVVNPMDSIGKCQIVSISCGMDHAGAVTALGSLFMWGSNVEGQLGCGNALGSDRHTKEPLLIQFERHTPIKQVACGSVHTLVLGQDSSVWAMGEGKMGKLGLVSDADVDVPTRVQLGHWGSLGDLAESDESGDEIVIYIACGQNNSGCVVQGRKDKHQVYLWGEGASGQIPAPEALTIGRSPAAYLVPKLAPQLVALHTPEQKGSDPYPEVSLLAFGTKHVVIGTSAGLVYTHGDNSFGQLGYVLDTNDGDNLALQLKPRLVPLLFLEGVKAKSIVCGERHTTICSTTGDVWSFGSGESHQIGIMDNVDQFQPTRAVGLGPAASQVVNHVSVGASISIAVTDKGETWMWGYGVESPTPTRVEGLKGKFIQRACIGSNVNIALLTGTDNDLYEWQFDGAALDEEETHGNAAGEEEGAAMPILNEYGEMATFGNGKGYPHLNTSLRGKKLIDVSAGKNHYMAITGDGKMFAWGSNHLKECGLKLPGEVTWVPHPMMVKVPVAVTQVKCGIEHSIALCSNGAVLTWGTGFEGRLGHISNADVDEPKIVQGLIDAKVYAKGISIGPNNSAAVGADGSLWIWGAGNAGQIGGDDLLPQFKPIRVKHLAHEQVLEVAMGNYHTMCLTAKKQVYTWGDNKFGQLGLYPAFQEDLAAYPQPVDSLNALNLQPSHIECGDNVCIVLTQSGELYGWGSGETNQLCLHAGPVDEGEQPEQFGPQEDCPAPVKLHMPFQQDASSFTKVVSISVRDINCACLTSSGDVWSWGWDLGEYPVQLKLRKPNTNAEKGALIASSDSSNLELLKWGSVTLGNTRMMLMTE